jgi:hypothetical protein
LAIEPIAECYRQPFDFQPILHSGALSNLKLFGI